MSEKAKTPGAAVRCPGCGKLTKSTYPCKVCGGVSHIVAITAVQWDPNEEFIETVMARGLLKVLQVWHSQARLPFSGKASPHAELIERATLIFDVDFNVEGDREIVITFYPRKRAVVYPPGQPT